MMLMPRSLAKPKMMSLVTLSASATFSGAAVNGINSSVGPRAATADWLAGGSRRGTPITLPITRMEADLDDDRYAAAKAALSDAGSMPSLWRCLTEASIWCSASE
jgi:hypothetical protein